MGKAIVFGCIIAVVSCASEDDPDDGRVVHREPNARQSAIQVELHAKRESRSEARVHASLDDSSGAPGDDDDREDSRPPALASSKSLSVRSSRSSNRCERLQVHTDSQGRHRYKRVRKPWTKADKNRFAGLVGLVAREMGADPRLFRAWAMRESTYQPHAMHVLNSDVEAATAAWRRLHYSADEEAELQAVMAEASAQDPRYWRAKSRLRQIRTFRDNPYLDDLVVLEVIASDGSRSRGSEPAWAFGYGPFGMNPAYFVPVWDAKAPPWIFCDDDGLVAIVTAIWSARTAQRECESQGFGGSYASVNRRFSKGHCGVVSERDGFARRARRLGLDPNARARLGRRWERKEADRKALLHTLRYKASSAGLLPPPVHSRGA